MNAAVEAHRAAGRPLDAGGVRSFVREAGVGEPVVCVHGVPTSSFLWRGVVDELAARGLRGIAFDLPGLGLADRPEGFDYRWTGLGRFAAAAVDALGLDRFHLVVHDIGGPVGFELAAARRDRVASLTVLNTMVDVDTFRRPLVMEAFARRGLGELSLATLNRPAFRAVVRQLGGDLTTEACDAHLELLKREDGGRAFLRIMRGFERTPQKRDLYRSVVAPGGPYPVQVAWGERDPALPLHREGESLRRAAGLDRLHLLPAKHFLQEEQAPAIAGLVSALARRA